jgi:hypothetical protein
MNMRTALLLGAACLLLGSCGYIAEHAAPRKSAASTRSVAARTADTLFWATLHGGKYEQIPQALEAETAAYLADPHDAVTAAHIGWLHIWRISERARLASVPATITDDALLARRYFEEAVAMNRSEARYRGFLASAVLADGSLNQNERLIRRGYFMLREAIDAWPEFNLFTAGYVMSNQPVASEHFQEALAWQWRELDVCVGEKVDRKSPDFSRYMRLETHSGAKRACWNSWIAPHNFEGFFLNMGDMLVKSGDVQTARQIYANAKLAPSYSSWPFRQTLEARIRDAADNIGVFSARATSAGRDAQHLMVDAAFSCMACHQQ